jgi:hypothetical protein
MKNWLIILALLLASAAGFYYYQSSRPDPEQESAAAADLVQPEAPRAVPVEEPEPEPSEPTTLPEAPQDYQPEPEVTENLPLLEESDPLMIDALSGLAGEAAVMQYLVPEDIVSHIVATIDSLTGRQVPGLLLPVQGPGGEFEATADDRPGVVITNEEGDPVRQYVLDPVNYQRYTAYVEIVEAVDAQNLLATYREHQHLFQQAWRELGYPQGSFDERLGLVIDHLLETPEPAGPIRLIKPEGAYLFADPGLEQRSAGQKTLIRMGNENARRIKAWLRKVRAGLYE